ncbi:FbpB family small basic protein [Alteribacter natronophilus]|nr:FbpB family small basic protein [Alteribacter natronophilus]TMW70622.1 FbpB family small basic protein [Alteribacter natronophilus]
MRKRFHRSFEELVEENRDQLLNDPDAIYQIEKKVDDRHAEESTTSKE